MPGLLKAPYANSTGPPRPCLNGLCGGWDRHVCDIVAWALDDSLADPDDPRWEEWALEVLNSDSTAKAVLICPPYPTPQASFNNELGVEKVREWCAITGVDPNLLMYTSMRAIYRRGAH